MNVAAARSPQPPSAFTNGLEPVASKDISGNKPLNRRASRTDLDFERALLGNGTVLLKEGVDVSSLGVDTAMNASVASPTPPLQNTPRKQQPATPTVVPPTPASLPVPSSTQNGGPSSQPSSSQDMYYDAEDTTTATTERQTNRRSMYRSPGTSSSPDLATLLRRAKGGVDTQHKKENRHESPPSSLPIERPSTSGRQRASTTVSSNPSTPQSTQLTKAKYRSPKHEIGSDWMLPSPRLKENGTVRAPKSSVRAKTSAFLGKLMGQSSGTQRERSVWETLDICPSVTEKIDYKQKTDASLPHTTPHYEIPSLFDAFAPPVPPIPLEHQQRTPVGSPIADIFTGSNALRPSDMSKPLSDVTASPKENGDPDERSIVFVERTLINEDVTSDPDPANADKARKRRSSCENELKKDMMAATSTQPAATPEHRPSGPRIGDLSSTGTLDNFGSELSQLDLVYDSLNLQYPSTPACKPAVRSATDGSHPHSDVRSEIKKSNSVQPPITPMLMLQIPSHQLETDSPKRDLTSSPIVPPRSASLHMPRPTARPTSMIGSHSTSRHASSPLRSRNGPITSTSTSSPRDAARLRTLHRSAASSSEPSLIPNGEGAHALPSRRVSQQDLSINDLTLARYSSAAQSSASPSLNPSEDCVEMEARGKELASRCWEEEEDFLAKEKIAEWLGGHGRINKTALRHYVNFFDFTGLRLDMAFRRLCSKLYLKAETQQVDRILQEFSRRYWECNPRGIYGSANIVHSVAYSLLLLNTDLHVADLTTRMSRNQFVRNTLTALQMSLQPTSPTNVSVSDLTSDDCSNIRGPQDGTEPHIRPKRSDSITSWNSVSKEGVMALQKEANGSTPSVQISNAHESRISLNPALGRGWEIDMETLLKVSFVKCRKGKE
ncbi:hypothetical protein C0992_012409 [Termitomyces sp. T32_za158]|nr:hypothetical protein C0992_012409 [Termitomyces sp. T32_za158]